MPYRLSAYGLTTENLVQQIMSMNRNVSGGSIVEMGKRYTIKGTSLLASQNDLDNLVVSYKSARRCSFISHLRLPLLCQPGCCRSPLIVFLFFCGMLRSVKFQQ